MFRVVAFYEFEATACQTTLNNVAGLPDSHVTVQGDNIMCPADTPNLMAIYAHGGSGTAAETDNMSQGRFESPSLKPYLDLAAWTAFEAAVAAHLPLSPVPINNYIGKGINLVPGENMQYKAAEVTGGGTDDRAEFAGVWLGDGKYDLGALRGLPMETLRFTGGSAAVAATWTVSAITFEQALKAGTYAVVGMKLYSTTPVLARLLFANQGARPGCIGCVTPDAGVSAIENPMFRNGNLGVWGTFPHSAPPQMELLCQAADAAAVQQGFLDVVKIA